MLWLFVVLSFTGQKRWFGYDEMMVEDRIFHCQCEEYTGQILLEGLIDMWWRPGRGLGLYPTWKRVGLVESSNERYYGTLIKL